MESPVIETTQGLERKITLTIDNKIIAENSAVEFKKIAKTARVDGFRKGKVPAHILEQQYGSSVMQDVLSELMHKNFYDVIIKERVNIAGRPDFTVGEFEKNKDFTYTATFEVYPEVEVVNIEKIKIEKPVAEVLADDVDKMLEVLRKQQGAWAETDEATVADSRVTIDFTGFIDGVEFEGGKATDFVLLMGQGNMIPGFEDSIIGHKAGESFDIEVTFPEEYHAENLQGKQAKFETVLKKVESMTLAEITPEFIRQFSPTSSSIEELCAEIKRNMERELNTTIHNQIKTQAIDGLLLENDIDVPKSAVEQECEFLKKQALERFGQQAANLPNLPNEIFEPQARRRVQIALLLGEFIAKNEIKADEAAIDAKIAEIASSYEDPQEVISYYKGNKEIMENISNVILEEQAINLILEKAIVTEKPTTFNEIIASKEQH